MICSLINTYRKLLVWQLVGLAFWSAGVFYGSLLATLPKLAWLLVHLLLARLP